MEPWGTPEEPTDHRWVLRLDQRLRDRVSITGQKG